MQRGRARTSGCGVPLLPLARWVGWVAPVCPTHGVLVLSCPSAALRVCSVLGHLAPVLRCARVVCCFACAVSWATWLLFTGVSARWVVSWARCPGPLGSCSPVRPLRVLLCVCGVLGLLAPVHQCALVVCCFACAVSWASLLLFTGVPTRCVVLRVGCPGPPGSCSPMCPLGVLCCVCGVLGHLAPVHRCARSVCCFACAVSWASWLLFTGVPTRCVVLRVWCPGPLGSCSPLCALGVLCCACCVLGHLAPVHRCARSVCCVACAVSWASHLLFTGVPAWCVVLRVRCPGPPGSCSLVCPLGVLCCCAGRRCGALTRPSGRRLSWPAGAGYPPGEHTSIRTAAVRSRQGLGTLRARTRPSGRRLFVAGRGWVPSGRALVHLDGGWRACACSLWPGRAGRPPGRVVVRLTFSFGRFVSLLCLAPSGLGLPPSLSLPLPFLVALALCFGCFSRPPAAWLFVRSRLVCVSRLAVGCSLVVSPPPPPPFLCLAVFVAPSWCLGVFFSFSSSPSSPVRPRCLRLSLVSGTGCPGPRRCALLALLAFRLSALRALVPLSCFRLAGGCSPVVAAPPPPFCLAVFVAAARCRVPCCAVRPWVRCCAALLRVVSCGVVLSCAVLCSLGAAACCAVPSGAARCPGALCSAALRFAVFPRAVCVWLWRGGACCCSPLCFVLCVFRGAVLCVPCPLRSVRCCASLCWCARVVLFVWCVLLLAPGAVLRVWTCTWTST